MREAHGRPGSASTFPEPCAGLKKKNKIQLRAPKKTDRLTQNLLIGFLCKGETEAINILELVGVVQLLLEVPKLALEFGRRVDTEQRTLKSAVLFLAQRRKKISPQLLEAGNKLFAREIAHGLGIEMMRDNQQEHLRRQSMNFRSPHID